MISAKFLNYLVPRCLRWAHRALIPKWEARRHRNGNLCVLDSGTTHLPLPIPLCSGEVCHLQWCVDAWHQQGSVHALTHPAPLVCLQLLRFHNEDGVMRRDSRPLQGHLATIHMPIFQIPVTRCEMSCGAYMSPIRSCPWRCILGSRRVKDIIRRY